VRGSISCGGFGRTQAGALEPVRPMTTRIGQNITDLTLILLVVDAIADNGIPGPLVLIGHRTRRLAPAVGHELLWRMPRQPAQMLLAAVRLLRTKPMTELNTEVDAECAEPLVVRQTLAHPNCARMFRIADGQVAALRRGALAEWRGCEVRLRASYNGQNPVRGVQKLRRLQNHLDNMLITVPARAARRLLR
jgi:hypothetical protein